MRTIDAYEAVSIAMNATKAGAMLAFKQLSERSPEARGR
jgi:hypothetical protein